MDRFPAFYDPGRIGSLFYPDVAAIAAGAAAAGLPPAGDGELNVHLLVVDMQVDFCHPGGSLYVPGALGDIRRTIEFIYRNAGRISRISCSLDSHLPRQIFTPSWWSDGAGRHPAPFTIISAEDVRAGRWHAVVEPEWSARYVELLEREHKKLLTIWPYHVQIGSPGHSLDAEMWSAVFWHSLARGMQPHWLVKGSLPATEHYSIIRPEVELAGRPGGGTDRATLDLLGRADAVFIAGEAESHCVLETVEDLAEEFGNKPGGLDKLYLLTDCTSPVVHPEIDFHALAQARLAELGRQGLHLVKSTDPWPL